MMQIGDYRNKRRYRRQRLSSNALTGEVNSPTSPKILILEEIGPVLSLTRPCCGRTKRFRHGKPELFSPACNTLVLRRLIHLRTDNLCDTVDHFRNFFRRCLANPGADPLDGKGSDLTHLRTRFPGKILGKKFQSERESRTLGLARQYDGDHRAGPLIWPIDGSSGSCSYCLRYWRQ